MKKSTLLLLYIFGITTMIFAQSWSEIIDVNTDNTKGYNRARISLVSGDIPLVSWGKKNNADVYVARKNSSGFGNPIKLNPNGMTVFAQDWAGPEMASFGNTVYVAFKSQPESEGFPYVVKSSDGGLNFSDTIRVSSNNWSRFPTPAIDENGKPYVAFMEFDSAFIDPHYAVATSTNNGQSFNTSVSGSSLAPGEVCDCCPAGIIAQVGQVSLLFRNNDNNLRDIWVAASYDNGSSFSKASDVDNNNWMINSCPSTGPDAIFTPDSMIFVWMSGGSGFSRVYLGTADKTNLTVGRNFQLNGGALTSANQNYPRIAGNKDTLGVVWQESGAGNNYIFGIFSTTGIEGLITNPIDTINDPLIQGNFNPDLAYSNGAFHVVWQGNIQKSVSYRKLDFDIQTVVKSTLSKSDKILLYPNPTNNILNIELPNLKESFQLQVFDLLGNVMHIQTGSDKFIKLDLSNYHSGIYTLSIRSGEHLIIEKFAVQN